MRAEKLGDKLVVHNYGHGGAGITLSWGTAELAVEEGSKSDERDCAVLGCGVVGLSDGAPVAGARISADDLRARDAAGDHLECRGRTLGPGNGV